MSAAKYLLEGWNGSVTYTPFNSIAEIDAYRAQCPRCNGEIFTHDGYEVDEERAREQERAELRVTIE